MPDFRTLQAIGLLFRSVNVSFRTAMDQALREAGVGVSFGEISPMVVLKARPGINGAQLARESMVSAQAMNAMLRRLAAKKYVERRPHPDSLRADSWYLTEKGARLLERSRDVFEAVTARMLEALSDRDVRKLESYLRSCVASLGSNGE